MEDFDIHGWVSEEVQAKEKGLTIHIRNSDCELNPLRHSDCVIGAALLIVMCYHPFMTF